jgi:hypothetical protein
METEEQGQAMGLGVEMSNRTAANTPNPKA